MNTPGQPEARKPATDKCGDDAGAPVTVMLVDDNAILAEALPLVLRTDGRFSWAGWISNGAEALEHISHKCPNLVLMDVDMPNVDTFALVRLLTGSCPNTKIVMFSGHVRQDYIEAAFDAGAYGYLHKDDEFPSLLESMLKAHAGEIVMSPPIRQMIWRQ